MSILIILVNLSKENQSIPIKGLTPNINSHFYFTIQKKEGNKSEILSKMNLFNNAPNKDFIKTIEEKEIKENCDLIIVINVTLLCNQIEYGRERFCKELESNKDFGIFIHQNLKNDLVDNFSSRGIKFSDAENVDKTFSQETDTNSHTLFKHPLCQRILNASENNNVIELYKSKIYKRRLINLIKKASRQATRFKFGLNLFFLTKLMLWLH